MLLRRFVACLAVLAAPAAHADALAAWMAGVGAVVSSVKITAMQDSAMAEKVANNKIQSAQAGSSSMIDLSNRETVRRTWNDFGPNGQLVDGCFQVAVADTTAQVKGRADASAEKAAGLVYSMSEAGDVGSGGVAGAFGARDRRSSVPFSTGVAKRAERHMTKYCSVSESLAGYCTLQPNGMQSGDSDFSLLYAPGQTYGWDQAEAATDFVKTVAPVKVLPGVGNCTTKACAAALSSRRAEEPYLSMARFSMLRFVESRSTQASGEAKQVAK